MQFYRQGSNIIAFSRLLPLLTLLLLLLLAGDTGLYVYARTFWSMVCSFAVAAFCGGSLSFYLRFLSNKRSEYLSHLDAIAQSHCPSQNQGQNREGGKEASLDLQTAFEIFYRFGTLEFPFLNTKSLEFGLFKTYSIPSISSILLKTHEMERNMNKRYDDTDLLIREFTEHDPSHLRSQLAIQRLNFLHSHYPISNSDYLYTLTVFMVEPILWIQRYGYREAHHLEKESLHLVWCDIGKKMGIRDLPRSWEEGYAWMNEYEATRMRFHPANAIIANATVDLFLSILPAFLRPFGYSAILAFCSPALREAMGFGDPPPGLSSLITTVMFFQATFIKYLSPPRSKSLVRTPLLLLPSDTPGDQRTGVGCPLFNPYAATYPDGYRIDELGPIQFKKQRQLCPLYPTRDN
jgi:hypothetical protein